MAEDIGKIQRTVKLYSSHEDAEADDREFYLSLTPNERVELLMKLRELWSGPHFGRLERTCQLLDVA